MLDSKAYRIHHKLTNLLDLLPFILLSPLYSFGKIGVPIGAVGNFYNCLRGF